MQISKLNRTGAENAYMVVTNVAGATITTGLPVALQLGGSTNGNNAVIANTATQYPGFVGVATQDIANNDVGRVQVSGFVNSVLMSNLGSSVTVTQGDPLIPSPAGFFSSAPTYANSGFKWLAVSNAPTNTLSTASYVSGLIKVF